MGHEGFGEDYYFKLPEKINQSFIKVRSPRELCNQIEQCSRLVPRRFSIKLRQVQTQPFIQDHGVLEPRSWNVLPGNLFVYRHFFSSSFLQSHSNTAASSSCMFVHICVCMDCGWWVQFIFDMQTFSSSWIPPFRITDHAAISLCEASRKISVTFRLVHTDRTPSFCCITLYCNAVSKQDYLPPSSGSTAVFLSEALGAHASSHPVIG